MNNKIRLELARIIQRPQVIESDEFLTFFHLSLRFGAVTGRGAMAPRIDYRPVSTASRRGSATNQPATNATLRPTRCSVSLTEFD
jgi:hypothetical protein